MQFASRVALIAFCVDFPSGEEMAANLCFYALFASINSYPHHSRALHSCPGLRSSRATRSRTSPRACTTCSAQSASRPSLTSWPSRTSTARMSRCSLVFYLLLCTAECPNLCPQWSCGRSHAPLLHARVQIELFYSSEASTDTLLSLFPDVQRAEEGRTEGVRV